jgi:hypothetical protein
MDSIIRARVVLLACFHSCDSCAYKIPMRGRGRALARFEFHAASHASIAPVIEITASDYATRLRISVGFARDNAREKKFPPGPIKSNTARESVESCRRFATLIFVVINCLNFAQPFRAIVSSRKSRFVPARSPWDSGGSGIAIIENTHSPSIYLSIYPSPAN